MKDQRIVIVGAGVSGLACAAKLKEAGLNPIIYDKGRRIGGRLATRRTDDGLQFDHGAQYMSAKTQEFRDVLNQALLSGMAGEWEFGVGTRYVGMPGMSGLAEYLGKGIDIKQGVQVTSVRETATGHAIGIGNEAASAKRLVITAPAPQSVELLGRQHPLASELAHVEMLPCLTLMVALDAEAQLKSHANRDSENPISWIALDSSKPMRTTQNCWVAQASPRWSSEFLEEDKSVIATQMLPLVCDRLGVTTTNVTHAVAHRWRYAAVSKPLGRPFAKNSDGTLYLGGDWCLDARVEAAWISGNAIATDILRGLEC